jgi:hypothetical protein
MAAMPRDVASRRPAPEPFGRFVARQRHRALRDGAVKVIVTEQVQRHAVTRTVASWHDASQSSSKIRDKAGKRAPSRRTSKPAGASARRTPAAEPIDPPWQPSAKQRRSFRRSAAHHEQMRKLAREAQWQLRDDPMAGDTDGDVLHDAVEPVTQQQDQPAVASTAAEVVPPTCKSTADAAVAPDPSSPSPAAGKRPLSPTPDAGESPPLPKRNAGNNARSARQLHRLLVMKMSGKSGSDRAAAGRAARHYHRTHPVMY